MTCGVPQGSVLEPTFGMSYDKLLRTHLPEGTSLVGFADDVTLTEVNRTSENFKAATNMALRVIEDWMINHEIELPHAKTGAIMLTRKWAYTQPRILVEGHQVMLSRFVRYLGVTLDSKLTFTRYTRAASASAIKAPKVIGRLMPNVGGPSVTKRRLLTGVVMNILLYAALIWAPTGLEYRVNRYALDKALRLKELRIIRGYRTISVEAFLFLAGIPPGDL